MLDIGDRVLVGVSGGADSTSLVLVLKELGYSPAIAHINHGLRGMYSDGDEQFVWQLASKLGIPLFTHRIVIRPEDGNIEEAGRNARKEFFRAVCENHGFTKIAVAHTRDDRVETCLLHMIRGAGIEGMVSMSPVSASTVRPLIETSRKMIEDYLLSKDQPWRTDATNLDPSFARNRLRHEVIPKLTEFFNPRLNETLSRTVDILLSEDAWMQELTACWLEKHAIQSGEEMSVDVSELNAAPIALARRAIRSVLRQVGSELTDVTFAHIEGVRRLLAKGKSGKTVQIPGGLAAERSFDRLVIRKAVDPCKGFDYVLPIPGSTHIPELGKIFRAGYVDDTVLTDNARNGNWVFVDGGRLGPYVKIRNWKPGDYYKPVGWPGGKLKKLFQRARIPRSQRNRWPVIENDSIVVWVASFPVSREFAPSRRSHKIVAFEMTEALSN
jgi:tRNA(Ile)-lysidine synthase